MDVIRKERDRLEKRTEEMEKEAATKGSNTVTEPEVAVADKKEEAKSMVQAEVKQEVPVIPSFPGVGYNVAVLDGNGKVVSFMPIERMERKRERSTMSAIFSRLAFKKKIDIVKLVAEKDLEPKQLVQIRSAIEKGLSEDQLLVLINNQIPATAIHSFTWVEMSRVPISMCQNCLEKVRLIRNQAEKPKEGREAPAGIMMCLVGSYLHPMK